MHWRIAIAIAAGASAYALAAFAQPTPTTRSAADARLDAFEQRLNEMERRHQVELQQRDQEIARLRAILDKTKPPSTVPVDRSSQDLLGQIDAAGRPAPATGKTDPSTEAALRDIGSGVPTRATPRTAASFNPDLAIVGDFHASISTDHSNPARNRFDLGSVELDLRAAVDPRADGVVILPVSREFPDPLFFTHKTGDESVETGIDLEEGYLFLHDFGVSNLTAKIGRFHLRFGRQNILHSHDWPTADNNFVNQSFLGPEALVDSGLSLSYVIPPRLVANQYIELIGEVITGEGNEESPVVNNSSLRGRPAFNLHALWNHDLTQAWNLEAGLSWLNTTRNNDSHQQANLFGIDLTLVHTDPSGGFNNQLLQAEIIYGMVDTSRSDTQYAWGGYLLGQQQLHRDWYAGLRLDWTRNATSDRQEAWSVSPYVSWYLSEFLRLRAEYQHKGGDVKTEDTLFLQLTFIFGAHPPHPYWAMR